MQGVGPASPNLHLPSGLRPDGVGPSPGESGDDGQPGQTREPLVTTRTRTLPDCYSEPDCEGAVERLFSALSRLESMLRGHDFLVGDRLTEADIRLFTTLLRFDPVYVGHFKCNRRRIVDYPHLWGLTRRIYALPGVAETVHLDHIKQHYYQSHRTINPTGIVPVGPDIDFSV